MRSERDKTSENPYEAPHEGYRSAAKSQRLKSLTLIVIGIVAFSLAAYTLTYILSGPTFKDGITPRPLLIEYCWFCIDPQHPHYALMTSQHDKPKRWRPRFSVRTLVIVVTLVCCYSACWGPTKRQGVEDVTRRVANVEPDLLSSWWVETFNASAASPLVVRITPLAATHHHYYFWFFGCVAKLPYERELKN